MEVQMETSTHTDSDGILAGRPRPISWVTAFTGKSKQTIYRWESQGQFPKRVRLGANSVAWLESEVREWLASRQRVGKS